MSVLTAARLQTFQPYTEQDFLCGVDVVYQGGLVMLNAGYAVAGADTASCIFCGVAKETVDNSAGSAGDKSVGVYTSGVFSFAASGAAVATWVGQKVFIVDDQTVALAATTSNDVLVGRCVKVVSATEVLVAIDTLSVA